MQSTSLDLYGLWNTIKQMKINTIEVISPNTIEKVKLHKKQLKKSKAVFGYGDAIVFYLDEYYQLGIYKDDLVQCQVYENKIVAVINGSQTLILTKE